MTSLRQNPAHTWLAIIVALGLVLTGLFWVSPATEHAAAQGCPDGSVLSSNGLTCELDVGQSDPNDPCPAGERLDAAGLFCEPAPDPTPVCGDGKVYYEAADTCIDAVQPSGGCPPGLELGDDGITCEIPGTDTPSCDEGEVYYEAADTCIDAVQEAGCPPGLDQADDGSCVNPDDEAEAEPAEPVCDEGFTVGADGVTCIADAPDCGQGEIVGDDGTCVKTFQCPPGLVLASDLLTCTSSGCPDDELLSVDGRRCVAADSNCPDGTPRPIGGSCLVVETVEGDDGTEIIVRCDDADAFCQAQVKACAEARAADAEAVEDGESCEDPRANCDEGDEACAEANERLVACATRDDSDDPPSDDRLRRSDPCEQLCPPLHRLTESGECVEYLDPRHPCVSFGQVPPGVTTNRELDAYSFLAGTGQCVTRVEFLRRLGNFEAAAGAEADALAELRATTSEYLSVEEQIVELEDAQASAEADVRRFAEEAAVADAERVQNEKDLQEARKQLQREMELLQVEVLEVYVTGGAEAATAAALLAADEISDVGLVQTYSRALLDDQIDNIDRIRALEEDTLALGVELEQAAAQVRASLDAAKVTSADIDSLLAQTERLRAEQLDRRDAEAAMVSALREEKGQFAQELGIFDQASREIADIISESEFVVTELETGDGLFGKPVIPADVVSGYGPRLHPILGYVRNHDGLDFDANFGDPIYASQSGVVQISSTFGGYGQTVVIDHGAGLLTLYAHMSTLAVEVGDLVERGEVIGLIGSTGLSTGPHLHFEVWIDGRNAVDPLLYLTDLD